MDGKGVSIFAIACSLVLAGCAQRDPLPFPRIAPADDQASAPGGAYEAYAKAAVELDQAPGFKDALLLRTSYSPGQRQTLEAAAKGPLMDLGRAMNEPCRLPYLPPDKPEALRYRTEWRMLSRAVCWRIADECEDQKYDAAIDDAILTTKFGFDLTSGPPRDASLGFVIVDAARKTIAGSLGRLNAKQLRRLSAGIKGVYLARPPILEAASAAAKDMLEDAQRVQDSYRDQNYAWIESALGDQAKEPVQYLTDLHQESDRKRAEYFDGLAMEAKAAGSLLVREAGMPLRNRLTLDTPTAAKQRPWKRFAQAFFGIGKPILAMNDAACARTQLLILECELMSQVKSEGRIPNDLGGFTRALTLDPYSGQPFVYRTDGKAYRIYSVGADLVDDNGDTDESFSKPDLTLEKP